MQNETTHSESNTAGLQLLNQYIKYINFESKILPTESVAKITNESSVGVDLSVEAANFKQDNYEVAIKADITVRAPNERELFRIMIVYAGVFTISDVDPEDLEMILLIYCPSIIFPFMRRAVSTVSSDGSFPPLMLDLVDFSKLYHDNKSE